MLRLCRDSQNLKPRWIRHIAVGCIDDPSEGVLASGVVSGCGDRWLLGEVASIIN